MTERPSPRVCLAMMVRNEAAVIGRCLRSTIPLVDGCVIHDSSEGTATKDAIFEVDAQPKVVLLWLEPVPWRDFGSNRTSVLIDASKRAPWVLMLDADMTVEGTIEELPDADALSIRIRDHGMEWRLPLLTRSGPNWQYRGRVHEYLATVGDVPFVTEPYDGIVITHHGDGGNQDGKLERALVLLREDYAEDPDNPRTVFYLAQTLRQLGHTPDEAASYYERRIVLGGYEEEVFYSLLQLGILRQSSLTLLQAYEMRPHRPEPLQALADAYLRAGMMHTARLYGTAAASCPPPKPTDLFATAR